MMKSVFAAAFVLVLTIHIVAVFAAPVESNRPPLKVSGRVTDVKGQPLPGARVMVKGGNTGAAVDGAGNYTVNVPDGNAVLIFSHMGFKTQEVAVQDRAAINITLTEDASVLNEVLVIGYGKQSRERLTTSVSKLDNKVLENIPYSNAAAALQGNIPGLRVQSVSGQPGSHPRVILRGGTSINNPNGASPLYIVDGIIRTNMSNIAADDIESLQVLKDAASTAIYGARGSNGVIIISTKSGRPSKTTVSYSYDLTVSEVGKRLEYASARDYIQYGRISVAETTKKNPAIASRNQLAAGFGTGNDLTKNTAYTTMYLSPDNQHKLNEGWQSMPDPLDPSKTIIFKETNYQDLIYRTARSHNHYLSVSGGSDKALFYVGVGYLMGEGVAISTDYRRLSLNVNGTLKMSDNLDITARVLYTNSQDNAVSSLANVFYRSASLPGTAKFQFEDGTLAPGQNNSIGNPKYFLEGQYALKGDNDYDNLSISLQGRWAILPGLTFEPQLSLYKARDDGYSFQPAYLNGVNNFVTTRNASASYAKTTQYQADAVLTYAKTFRSAHNLEAKAGFSHFARDSYSQTGSGQGAATDLIPTLNASSLPTAVGGSQSPQVIQGVFSRINYDYKGKYLFSVNARYDGASNLGTAYRFGFFPGISAGWNVHEEGFWKDILPANLLDLKLRASYGVNGNISGLGDFQAQGAYAVGAKYADGGAIQPSIIPNPDLKWEESRTFDAGFDLGIFDKRVSLIFDYYSRVTKNLLTNVSLPASTGYATVLTNLGSLGNKGVEVEIAAQLLPDRSPFQWSVSFNAAKTTNEILKLPDNGIPNNRIGGVYVWDPATKGYNWFGGLQEGGRIGDMYAYHATGVYATDADAAKGPVDMIVRGNDKSKFGGDAIWEDRDGNNIIDDKDQVYVGNPYPTWTGGFASTLSYRNFSFTVRTDFTTGHTIYNYVKLFADGQLQGDALPSQDYINRMWKKQGDVAEMPRYLWQDQQANMRGSTYYYEKGDFLALREVTLSYALPENLLKRFRISSLRFKLTGNNLYYFTGYKGLNPEEGGQDNGHYPIPRNFIAGVKVSF